MGNKQTLSQQEINELCQETNFTPKDLKRIYKRFQRLDFFKRGYVTVNDLMTIPDIDKNPLGERICKTFTAQASGGQNGVHDKNMIDFKEFVRALSIFNDKQTQQQNQQQNSEEEKIRFLFNVYDIDSDGLISQEELKQVLKQLVGTSLSDLQLQDIVEKTIQDLDQDGDGKLKFEEFKRIFNNNNFDL
eukprot:403348664